MQYKCGLTINNEVTDSCKECKYNGFENREECFDRQEYAMEQMVSAGEKPWIYCSLDEIIDSCE